MSTHESWLEYQMSVTERQQFFEPVFIEVTRLLMLNSMLHFRQNEGESSILMSNLHITKCHRKWKH